MEIVNESIARDNQNDRLCLRFSVEAENRWIEFYNKVESDMAYSAPYQILETMHLRSQKIWPEWPLCCIILMAMMEIYLFLQSKML